MCCNTQIQMQIRKRCTIQHVLLIFFFFFTNLARKFLWEQESKPGRMKSNTCFLRDTWKRPTTSFHTAANATSQGTVTLSEESTIYPLLNMDTDDWLMSLWSTGERTCHPSHPANTAKFVLLNPKWLWHCLNSRIC